MTYIDASCVIALIREEPPTEAVTAMVASEDHIILSSLADVETRIELRCGYLAGHYSAGRWREYKRLYDQLRVSDPFHQRAISAGIWEVTLRQLEDSVHCRTLDRLHLAAAEIFGVKRLMTLDLAQAKAARALGLQVIVPS